MEIGREELVALLRERGLVDRAAWVERQMPERIDVDTSRALLAMLKVDVADLQPV
jgi:hypothetical protein